MSGFAAVIVGVITVEVRIVVGRTAGDEKKEADGQISMSSRPSTRSPEAKYKEFEAKHKESEARAEKLAAENADLRQRLEDTKQ